MFYIIEMKDKKFVLDLMKNEHIIDEEKKNKGFECKEDHGDTCP